MKKRKFADSAFLPRRDGARAAPGSRQLQGISEGSWEGQLSVNPRGFGFVSAAGKEDVFIAPTAIDAALHGDRVRVEIVNRSPRGLEGRVAEIVQRRKPEVGGTLRRSGKSAWLEPDDTRLRGPIVLSTKALSGKDGDAAVARIERFPLFADENPEGVLIDVLGPAGDPRAEVAKILLREQVSEVHPEEAVKEAYRLAEALSKQGLGKRRDLRGVPLPTIDPQDARDHDDALWAEPYAGGYRVYVAIADVSEYVRPGSALDEEARNRGCTIYLPDRAIPMLPSELAAKWCSLLPEVDRLCMALIAEVDRGGQVKSFELVEGLMRSKAKLTYNGVARTLGLTAKGPRDEAAEALRPGLECLYELSRKLRQRRFARGALGLDLPEAQVVLDETSGAPVDVVRRAEDAGVKEAYSIVEEFMLLANELVAEFMSKSKSPTIYRVHGKPAEEKLERLGDIASVLDLPFDAEAMREPLGVSQWLQRIAGHPKRAVAEMALLRSLKQATYDTTNIGHFGLASEKYLHFTSPIRRYPDLLVHRLLKHLLRGNKPDTSAAALEGLQVSATLASARERASMDIEREVVDLYRALFMRDKVGETFVGIVSAFVGSGAYVTLKAVFVDVLVRFESMGPDHYELDESELSISGARSGDRVELGDEMVVVIEDVALMRRATFARRVPPVGAFEAEQGQQGQRRSKGQAPGALGRAPSRRAPSRSELSRGGPSHGAPNRGAPSRGASRSESSRSESSRSEPSRGEPSRGASRGEPGRGEPSRGEPSRGQPPRAGSRGASTKGDSRFARVRVRTDASTRGPGAAQGRAGGGAKRGSKRAKPGPRRK